MKNSFGSSHSGLPSEDAIRRHQLTEVSGLTSKEVSDLAAYIRSIE